MNGKRAKYLEALARKLLHLEGISPGDKHGEYNQLENCVSWEPHLDDMGHPIRDPEGMPLLKALYKPGTIFHASRYKMLYRRLKNLWKETGGKHAVFTEAKVALNSIIGGPGRSASRRGISGHSLPK